VGQSGSIWFFAGEFLTPAPMENNMKHLLTALATAVALVQFSPAASARPFTDPRAERSEAIDQAAALEPRDPACQARTLVAAGGAFPHNPHTLALRWIGFSNFELVYNGHVILLDAYYDRGSEYPPLGVSAADIKTADLILMGHGHFDHMSDAASIGARTKALLVGAAVTTDKLRTQPIPIQQIKTVTGRGGEILKFDNFTVEPILGRHGEPAKEVTEVMDRTLDQLMPAPTAEQKAEGAAIRARGTNSPRVIDEGTIAYLITLDDGFRILYRDSGGQVTDYERAAMARVGRVDLALVAVSGDYLNPLMVKLALEHMRTYKPDVIMPAHHDAPVTSGHVAQWRATEPLFQAMKDENPAIVTVSKQYREPVCFNTEMNIQHGN
jgi:L-ascorbate metabolism protein UlaG (beta-lactamase superfamily)